MSRAQAENVIKNIIREIAQECATKGQALSETLVAFMVKAVVLDPRNDFNVERTLTKDDVQRLIKICVDRLLDAKSPCLDTIKMQVYFDMNYTSRSDFLDEHRRVLESRLMPVIREITDSRARTKEELESLYRKIVSSVLLRSGLGSPTDISVVREATAALQSIFPQTELGTFMSLAKRDKERQLQELTMIVTGIRLFNKECGKGGDGIDDLPAILNEAVPATTQNIDAEILQTVRTAFTYTALCERFEKQKSDVPISLKVLKDSIINCRQHQQFLKVLLNDVIGCAQQVESLESQLASRLEQLQATVQSKTAVPTAQVYPQFIHLSQIWSGFQDEMVLLSVLSNILGHRELFGDEVITPFLQDVTVEADEDRIARTSGLQNRIDVRHIDMQQLDWLFPETTKNFNKLPLQYRGFCGWAVVNNDGLLLPVNRDIGVLRHNDCYYAFSSKEAAFEFAVQPDRYITMVGDVAKRSPELIQLLELHSQFSTISPYSQTKEASRIIDKPVTKAESGTQTDTHILEPCIVKSHEWNEWELRRQAVRLANLRTRVTHSVQTNLSNMRRDNVAQCYPPKNQTTQTKKDNYTNVPKPQVFIAGLRGGGMSVSTDMKKVDLTVDVDQS